VKILKIDIPVYMMNNNVSINMQPTEKRDIDVKEFHISMRVKINLEGKIVIAIAEGNGLKNPTFAQLMAGKDAEGNDFNEKHIISSPVGVDEWVSA
jgi:hypothetical protein